MIKKMEAYSWPGNIRELVNSVERAMIMVEGDELKVDDFYFDKRDMTINKDMDYNFSKMSLKEMEKKHIENVLENCMWNQKEAAKNLGIGYNTLWRKIKEYNIEKKAGSRQN